MNIGIIGAGGSIGRQIAQMVVAERLLSCDERLILCGNPEGASSRSLYGFAVDLMDAYAEICPAIDVVFEVEKLKADLIIMAGGITLSRQEKTDKINRDDLAVHNIKVFEKYAAGLATHGHGHELVICISNPNELAVAVFAKHLGAKRVIGMGSFLDSLRFRKEIAMDLNIRRQRIHGFIIGEHGAHMVPLWSSIHIYGFDDSRLEQAIQKVRKGYTTKNFFEDARKVSHELKDLVLKGNVREAYEMINQYPPDIRVAIKPFITHFSGSKTVAGTARATMDLIRTIMMGNDALIAGQIHLEGEFHNLSGTLGVPFVIGNQGVERIIELSLDKEEKNLLLQSADKINQKLNHYL